MPSSLKDFKVLAALGKGSYGSVMKVERISDACSYAVKEVNIRRLSPRERCVEGLLPDRNRRPLATKHSRISPHNQHPVYIYFVTCSEDALNEIRILASIKHRNIVR